MRVCVNDNNFINLKDQSGFWGHFSRTVIAALMSLLLLEIVLISPQVNLTCVC